MTDDSKQAKPESKTWPIILVFACWTLTLFASVHAYQPIDCVDVHGANLAEFSSTRAMGYLNELVGDDIPHPAGSKQNETVRKRIVQKLESFGYDVELQTANIKIPKRLEKRAKLSEVDIHNIVAIRKGTEPGNAIALVTHYDSHPNGPGACDDGVATAALLEIARLYSLVENQPRRDLVFLITDGEEFGLLGAKAFSKHHPLAKKIGLAINLEARGTTGPSMMFETSPMSRKLVPVFARTSPKPYASSLFREIYKRLPNDTDFTVFNNDGKLGFNFAFIGDVKNYHTPADNFENVDQRCLEHHGRNALGLLREIQRTDELNALIDEERAGWSETELKDEIVYFDLFAKRIVWWPANYSVLASLVAVFLFLVARWQLSSNTERIASENASTKTRSPLGTSNSIKTLGVTLLLFVAIIVFGLLLHSLVRLDPRLSNPWPSQPVAQLLTYWFASFAIVGAGSLFFKKAISPYSCFMAWCLIWLLASVSTSVYLVGGSFLFLVPVLSTLIAAVLANTFLMDRNAKIALAITMAAISTGVIWLPLERLFYDAVGFRMAALNFFRISIAGTSLIGLLSFLSESNRFRFSMGCVFVSVIALIFAIASSS